MKSFNITLLFVVSGFLTACGSVSLKPEQTLDLSSYNNKVYEACLKSDQYKDSTMDDRKTLCESRAKMAMRTAGKYFNLYSADTMISQCENKEQVTQTSCYLDYQTKYYDKAVDTVIENY